MTKCGYCDKEIQGRRFYMERFQKFEIAPVITEVNPQDFLPKRESVCAECLQDMGIIIK